MLPPPSAPADFPRRERRRRGQIVPDEVHSWQCCEVKFKEGDRQLLLAGISRLISELECEHNVLETVHRSQMPRRPNTALYVDVLEMFAGTMPFTRAAAELGLTALEPQDLWNGWDYHRQWDLDRTFELVEAHRPRIIIAGVECTPWCWFNVFVNYKDRPAELADMQRRSLVFLRMCESLFEAQLKHGDEMFLENPVH